MQAISKGFNDNVLDDSPSVVAKNGCDKLFQQVDNETFFFKCENALKKL